MSERTKQQGAQFLISGTTPEAIFTPEDFTDEHRMIANLASDFAGERVRSKNEQIEQQDFDVVVSFLREAGELGLLGHSVPEEYGGLGLDKVTKGIVGEAIAKAGGSYAVAHNNHTCIATLPITYFGTPEQKEKYLPKLASGEYIGAYCLTEPSAGSDALGAKTTAYLNDAGTHYVLNGTKQFITNAAFSDTFIVYAKVDGDKFTAFIVEKDFAGLSLGPEEEKMGIKGSSTCQVYLEDCLVPTENVLGQIGRGHAIAFGVLNLGRFNLGGVAMGGAKAALEMTIDYVKERRQFGKTLASFRATQEKIANIAARIYAAESLQYRTADLLEGALGKLYTETDPAVVNAALAEYALECSICKVFGSEVSDMATDEGVQLHGGYGYVQEYPIEQAYRDSRINRIFEGTNEINRLLIPGTLLRKAQSGEIDVKSAMTQAVKELDTDPGHSQYSKESLDRELDAVAAIRRVFLGLMGLAVQTFGKQLDEEQETLMKLADIGIELYASESAVLRTLKAIQSNGWEKELVKIKLTQSYVEHSLLKVEMSARTMLSGLVSGEELEKLRESLYQHLTRLTSPDGINRNRTIAARILEKGAYIS